MDLDSAYPGIEDLRARARRRVPHYVWEYFDSATGDEGAWRRAEAALDAITLTPAVLEGEYEPDLTTRFLGRTYAAPFGVAPVGMSGIVWPRAEMLLAEMAGAANIPYAMSTVAVPAPEEIAPHLGGGAWFQLYAPNEPDMRRDMMARARDAGFEALVLTVDVPVLSWREREKRVGLKNPMPLTPRVLWQTAQRPAWAWGMAQLPAPRPRIFDKYADSATAGPGAKHVGLTLRSSPDWDYWRAVRAEWTGPLIVKGVLDPAAAQRLAAEGADAIWVSNHGGRQFQAAPAPVEVLPLVRDAVGPDLPLIYDGAIRSGTDILRAIARGADFVMLGRAFHYGVAAAGARGAAHVAHLLRTQMKLDMPQIGARVPADARTRA